MGCRRSASFQKACASSEVGDAEVKRELFTNFGVAMFTGVLMVFAVLVLLFARVFQPITILSALPLSIGGASLALLLVGFPLSLPVLIGFLMLMGIVAKNSIPAGGLRHRRDARRQGPVTA